MAGSSTGGRICFFFFFVIELKVDIKIQDIYKVMQYNMSN